MKTLIIKCWTLTNLVRTLPAFCVLFISKSKWIIKKDVERWIRAKSVGNLNYPLWFHFHLFMLNLPEFRSLFYYRLKKNNFISAQVLKIFYRPLSTLYIQCPNIGEGFYIQHGFSTIIACQSIGKNCSTNQQVTVGYYRNDSPIIGDNVEITAGAKVIGKVRVGNNVRIGANSVVVKDVPDNCTVVGIPARIVRLNGDRIDIAL